MLVRLIIETMNLDARGNHYEQGTTGPFMRGDILEGQNWKHLDSGSSCWFMMDLVTEWLKELLMVFLGKQEQ